MPAPPSELVEALRKGQVARHVFFELSHSSGTLRVWDGVGDFVLDGNSYTGISGGHEIDGISDSGDIQNHTIAAKLNRVPLDSMFSLDPDIRNRNAVIRVAWFYEDGSMILEEPRVVARARGSHLLTDIDANNNTITAVLRGPLSEWLTAPRASYTARDQQRRFPGDTGFDFVKLLENTSIAGWSKDEEASGGVPVLISPFAGPGALVDSVSGAVIGADTVGAHIQTVKVSGTVYRCQTYFSTIVFKEADTAVENRIDIGGDKYLKIGSTNCYVDINGVIRSPGGKLIILAGLESLFMRVQDAIASDGTRTGLTVTSQSFISGGRTLVRTGGTFTATDNVAGVYCNKYGYDARHTAGTVKRVSTGESYVEASTGNPVTFTGGNVMQVNGANCETSNTGVLLTAANNRVHLAGDEDAFLRQWT